MNGRQDDYGSRVPTKYYGRGPQPNAIPHPVPGPTREKKIYRTPTIWVIVVIILVATGLGVGLGFGLQDRNNSSTQSLQPNDRSGDSSGFEGPVTVTYTPTPPSRTTVTADPSPTESQSPEQETLTVTYTPTPPSRTTVTADSNPPESQSPEQETITIFQAPSPTPIPTPDPEPVTHCQQIWRGTAPFCNGKCETGWTIIRMNDVADQVCEAVSISSYTDSFGGSFLRAKIVYLTSYKS